MSESQNRRLAMLVTAGILLVFAVMDYATPQVLGSLRGRDSEWIAAICIGVCVAQVTLIAAWAVFAPGNIVVRLPWSLLLGLTMWYVLAYSEQTVNARYGNSGQAIAILGINMLLGVVSLQIPLWIAKRAFRYRMLSPGEAAVPTAHEKFQFEIKHLLIGTAVFAIALSPIHAVVPDALLKDFQPQWQMFFVIGVAIAANLVATLPCLWGGFVGSSSLMPLGFGWLIYCLLVTGLELGIFSVLQRGPPHTAEALVVIYLLNVTQGAVVFGVMRAYHAIGYRLQRVPREMPPPKELQEMWEAALVEPVGDSNKAEGAVE
jgi:hypothetical protein